MQRPRAWHSVAALAVLLLAIAACESDGSGGDGGMDSGTAGTHGGAGGTSGRGGSGGGGTGGRGGGGAGGGVDCGPTICAPGQICMPSPCEIGPAQCFAVSDAGCPVGTTQVATCSGIAPACEAPTGCWEQPPPRCVNP